MRQRVWLKVGIAASLVTFCTVASAAVIQRIEPKYMDVEALVAMLWGSEPVHAGGDDFIADFATDLVYRGAEMVPRSEGQWTSDVASRTYPSRGTSSRTQSMVPAGILGRPLVVPQQNAIIVKGDLAAIDELREVIAMFDRPVDMVKVDVREVDLPEEEQEGWGFDWYWTRGNVDARGGGQLPADGQQLRLARRDAGIALRTLHTSSRGSHVLGASVVTQNNAPAVVVFGETVPFLTYSTNDDGWGNRIGRTSHVNSVFLGIDVWVTPRINADNTVTMVLEPTLSEWAGEVAFPGTTPIPITRTAYVQTTVTVRDGESMVIGGLNRSSSSMNRTWSGLFSRINYRLQSDPIIVVTPTIIRHQSAIR